MTTTAQIINRFIDETGIGFYGTLDSAPGSGSTITDLTRLGSTNYAANEFSKWWVWLLEETQTANNAVKSATSLVNTTGVLSVTPTYSSATGTAYYLLKPEWHPKDQLMPLLNRALEEVWQWWRTIVSVVPNGDSESASVGGSDSSATTTRGTTAANVFQGQAALQVVTSGANGYHQYADFDVAADKPYRVTGYARIGTTGATAKLALVARTGTLANTVIGYGTAVGVGQYHYIEFSGLMPSDCYTAAIRIGSANTTETTHWDDVSVLQPVITVVEGPSWVTQWRSRTGENLFRLYRANNRLTGEGTAAARAYNLSLVDPQEYQILNIPSAANPARFELGQALMQHQEPLVIEARRPFSDFGALVDSTSTTAAPVRLVVKAMKWLAAKERKMPEAEVTKWKAELDEEQGQAESDLRGHAPDQEYGLFYTRLR